MINMQTHSYAHKCWKGERKKGRPENDRRRKLHRCGVLLLLYAYVCAFVMGASELFLPQGHSANLLPPPSSDDAALCEPAHVPKPAMIGFLSAGSAAEGTL